MNFTFKICYLSLEKKNPQKLNFLRKITNNKSHKPFEFVKRYILIIFIKLKNLFNNKFVVSFNLNNKIFYLKSKK